MSHWFQHAIVDSGKLPLFCFFVAVIVGFAGIRFSTRMIRAQVRWWPGNFRSGDLHVHHVVFGVVFMIIGGLAGFALPDQAVVELCLTAVLFGVGVALVLDEFALILHLEDVYWSEAGRTSINAVFVAVAVTGLLLLGLRPDVGYARVVDNSGRPDITATVISTALAATFNLVLAGITLLKGKIWTGLLGLFIPVFMLVGAIRVGRPHSPWARWRYRPERRNGTRRMATARRREARYREPMIRAKIRFQEFLAGRPDRP